MNATNSNDDLKKQLEFFQQISDIRNKLSLPGIESKFPDENQQEQFIEHRKEWILFVHTVQINIATVLVDQLERNEPQFKAGIKAINEKIKEIDDTVGFLNLLGQTLQILSRIVPLVI